MRLLFWLSCSVDRRLTPAAPAQQDTARFAGRVSVGKEAIEFFKNLISCLTGPGTTGIRGVRAARTGDARALMHEWLAEEVSGDCNLRRRQGVHEFVPVCITAA